MTVEKTINIAVYEYDIKFQIDIDVYLNDHGKPVVELKFKSSSLRNNNSFVSYFVLYKNTMIVHDTNNIKKMIQEMEEKSIDIINELILIEQDTLLICNELSYITTTY